MRHPIDFPLGKCVETLRTKANGIFCPPLSRSTLPICVISLTLQLELAVLVQGVVRIYYVLRLWFGAFMCVWECCRLSVNYSNNFLWAISIHLLHNCFGWALHTFRIRCDLRVKIQSRKLCLCSPKQTRTHARERTQTDTLILSSPSQCRWLNYLRSFAATAHGYYAGTDTFSDGACKGIHLTTFKWIFDLIHARTHAHYCHQLNHPTTSEYPETIP